MANSKKKVIGFLWWSGLLLMAAGPVGAYVSESGNYRLQSDSVNFSGGLGASSNYQLDSTLGEIATGLSSSSNYQTKAGYQQMLGSFITLSSPSDINLSPAISNGVGQSTGSAVWTIITDNPTGYSLMIRADSNPALRSGSNSLANYTPAGSDPDYQWSVTSGSAEFGFSPEGTDLVSRYLDNGTSCAVGALTTSDRCWDALTTSDRTIASAAAANQPLGTATTVKFMAEVTSGASVITGAYSATVIATAMAL